MERFIKLCSCTMVLFMFLSGTVFAEATTITGAGATFPYPIYTRWAHIYQSKSDVRINYQAIGSGGGIKQIQAKTVDFGASDKPLTTSELKKSGLIQFPTVIGAIVPVVNIPGIQSGQLKLSGELLADIYLGKLKKWNDPAIKALNINLPLPDQNISVVHRSDGSGTTFLFTAYLSKISNKWKEKVGNDTAIEWPTGIGGKGNEGVAAYVQRIKGAIGYVEFAYTQGNQLSYVKLQNKAGHFVVPSMESFKAAAANADWQSGSDFAISLIDEPGDNSWPIIGATYILMQTVQIKPEQGKKVLQFFNWAYHHGQDVALQLNYIPLSDSAVKFIENEWKNKIKDPNGKNIWP